MNIQIFGTKKCRDSRKAERWFKERGVSFQFIDLADKGISPRELESVLRFVDADDLLDSESKEYGKRGLAWMEFDAREEILNHPLLLKTPVVRNGKDGATAGMAEQIWKAWLAVEKK